MNIAEEAVVIGATCKFFDSTLDLSDFYRRKEHLQYDGIIFMLGWGCREHERICHRIELQVPSVNIMLDSRYPNRNYVGCDDAGSMQALLVHLVSEGFQRIGLFNHSNQAHTHLQYRTYNDFIRRNGLPLRQEWVAGFNLKTNLFKRTLHKYVINKNFQNRNSLFDAYMNVPERPAAIIFSLDLWAIHFCEYAKERGIRIPEDIAIATFESGTHQEVENNFLTIAREDHVYIAKTGVRLLNEIIQGRRERYNNSILFPPDIIIRKSSLKNSYDKVQTERDIFKHHVASCIHQYYADNELKKTICTQLGISKEYFFKKFKIVFGKDFSSHIIAYRLEKAAYYLMHTITPITEILFNCGFNNSQNFNYSFRKKYGCTPKEYRKRKSIRNHQVLHNA
ncbi:MAG: helix-turn-helix domain-containing protein [Spirochaetes bacterium]|nr:helix-turn-helix domain-containing protein [Spirochaetota bacterium]